MALRVSGKNIEIGEALRTQITDRVLGVVGKFYAGAVSGHVTVTREGSGIETDCVLHLSSGVILHAEGFAQEAYAVIPSAVCVGNDEVNANGSLKSPWGVDYSKYVPDIIVELQNLRKQFEEYKANHP